jgi:peptidoglycan/LPS O-acetylase OafA/YrhL
MTTVAQPGFEGEHGTRPEPTTGSQIKAHVPALDGVRGLAILMVLVMHFIGAVTPVTRFERGLVLITAYGGLGVNLFFVLSGFLITGILCDSRRKPDYFRNFYMRRVLRIFPLYYGVLLLGLVIVPHWWRLPDLDRTVHHQGWLWAYSANFFLAYAGTWKALPVYSHFWSLAVEEHFYFVWPLVVFACGGMRLKRVALIVACSALLIRLAMAVASVNDLAIYVLTPGRLDGLVLGGWMAVVAREPRGMDRLRRLVPPVAWTAVGILVATILVIRFFPQSRAICRVVRDSVFTACFCVLLTLALSGPRIIQRFFQSRTMSFFGKYSYGLYVFHFMFGYYLLEYETVNIVARWVGSHTLGMLVQAAAAIAFAVLISVLSYHLYEKHFLKLKAYF